MNKQFSPACQRNQEPILAILKEVLADKTYVLEIGSGTGQHAVYFGRHLPHLTWQTSDLPHNHESILAWQQEAQLPNVLPPLSLDAKQADWPGGPYDAVFTANTCHIMSWEEVQAMFAGIAHVLSSGGMLCIYGPFNYGGQYTSDSNARFDASLKEQAPHIGLRNIEEVEELARANGLQRLADKEMPSNNRLLIWMRR